MTLILIADDDRQLVHLLEQALDRYMTCNASDGASVLHAIKTDKPDLVLLDLGFPDVDGGVLIGKIRETSKVPIIVLSGRHAQVDRVMALRAGADDFIDKPYDLDDLEARVAAVLRRCSRVPLRHGPVPLAIGRLSMSKDGGQSIDGKALHLSPTERLLLLGLVERAGEVVTAGELAERIWGSPYAATPNGIGTVVGQVRARLRVHAHAPAIETVRARGFRIQTDESPG